MEYVNIIQKAIIFMHKHYTENLTVADIANHVYLSSSYFSTVFRANTGYTVKDYFLKYRRYRATLEL
ncbi:MAG: helix-turn-helix transcriptional regulator [Clostridia bacterium]